MIEKAPILSVWSSKDVISSTNSFTSKHKQYKFYFEHFARN